MTPTTLLNRENWLQGITSLMRKELFVPLNYTMPELQVSTGFTSKTKAIGQCWYPEASADNRTQIFIHPGLTSLRAGAVLAHELVHATLGPGFGHRKEFKRCAVAIGLTGKMTATSASNALIARLNRWIKQIGEYPHAKLDAEGANAGPKKQKTRMLKVICGLCGKSVRGAKSTLRKGLPFCGDPGCFNAGGQPHQMQLEPATNLQE